MRHSRTLKPRRRFVPLLMMTPALLIVIAGAVFLEGAFPSTTALFTDVAPETGNTFAAAYWDDLGAIADTHVNQASSTSNYGTDTTAEVRSWGSGGGKNERTLAEFDLSIISPGTEVLRAHLTLCATAVPSPARTYDVRRIMETWTETGATWNNQPAVSTTVTDSQSTPGSPGCITWSVADDVMAWVVGAANNGLRVSDSVEGGNKPLSIFRTRENTLAAERPSLFVVHRPCTDVTAPAQPLSLVASGSEGLVGLDWADNVELDLAGYDVHRSTTAGGPYTVINGSLVLTSDYTDTAVTNGTTYYYVITALDNCANESSNSVEQSATPQAGPPAAPTGLVATPGNTEVALDWNDNAEPDLAGYNVYRSTTPGGPYSQVNGPLVTVSNYTDTGLSNGTTYYYVVRAENDSAEESGNSNEANATPADAPPAPPTGLVPTPSEARVDLDWNDNGEPDLAGYNVYRSTTSGGPYSKINGTLLTTSDYADTGLTNGTTYYYVVRAEDNAANESGNSSEVNATPTDAPPAAPTGLIATAGDKEISLDWADNGEPDLDGYNVYRAAASGGPFTKINGALVSTSDYTDTGLTGGVTYYYVVRAVDTGAQESGDSNEANAVPYSILIAGSDARVQEKNGTTNYGTATTLKVQSWKNGNNIRTFVQFDVSSIPAGSTVSSATLTLCATTVPSSTRTYDAHLVTSSWSEGSVTWNTQPSVAGAATDSATTPGSAACMTWTTTSDVQAWVDGTANNGWRISDSAEGNNQRRDAIYRSREDTAVPADRPNLTVVFTAP